MTPSQIDGPVRSPDPASPMMEIRAGFVAVVLFFVFVLGWASIVRLDAGAYASGLLTVVGERQAVQHRDGGVVELLNVAEGDHVEAGQLLLKLSSGELQASERAVAGEVFSLMALRARLVAEQSGATSLPAPPDFARLSAEDAGLAERAMRIQLDLFAARRQGQGSEAAVLQSKVRQLTSRTEGHRLRLAAARSQRLLVADELAGTMDLFQRGFAPLTRVRALERTAAQMDGDIGAIQSQIHEDEEAIRETRLLLNGLPARTSQDNMAELQSVETRLNEQSHRLTELRARIRATHVRAPVTGEVVALSVFTRQGVVEPGATLMDIVPSEARRVIVAQVNPQHAAGLTVGQVSEVRFPGLRGLNPPIIRGQVTRVAADTVALDHTAARYYRVEVELSSAELEKLGLAKEDALRPGTPAEVVILLRKRTALDYLVEPLTRNFWKAGRA